MYLDIVRELRDIIKNENIKTGGKIPSERVLAERLQVGRSTVREAFRSLELLGIIETKRGEGTFLADFQKHQFVEVLADFIMQQPDSVVDAHETRRIHEIKPLKQLVETTDFKNCQYGKAYSRKSNKMGKYSVKI